MKPAWWQPSLTRRVTLALLAAFVLVWSVLLTKEYVSLKQDLHQRESLQHLTQALVASLDFDDANRARQVLQASEVQYNHLRRQAPLPYPGDLLLILEHGDGRPVYASAQARGTRIPNGQPGPERQTLGRRVYWSAIAYAHRSPLTARWRLQVLEPVVADSRFLVLIGADLLPSLLIALPLVVLPVWLAVRRGLRPLRRLTDEVAARTPHDFSPLKLQLQEAELRPLVRTFNALFAHARDGIARERALVHDAAHELRTPLAVVAAQAHVLTHATETATRQQAQDALEHAVARTSHLVEQLLTLASLENAEIRPCQTIDLVEVARMLLIAATPTAAAKHIELSLDSPEQLPCTLDVAAFHSVLENLLANAIAYSPVGAEVQVSLETQAQTCCLRVSDNGPGIAPEALPALFTRFRRGRHDRSHGSGLGLAIVRQAVRRLGGLIETGPGLAGRGAGFVVRFSHTAPDLTAPTG